MQDLLRRMRLREELLNGTEKAPMAGAERNVTKEKQIGAILLPQNRHLAPVVRNHETPADAQSHSETETEEPSRAEKIAEQVGKLHDNYQKARYPVEYAKAKAKDKLRAAATEKLQQHLGAERFAKLQKHAAAYQKYRHPVRHVKRKVKQAVKKIVKRLIPLWVKVWLVVALLVSLSLVMLIATIWNGMGWIDKGKLVVCATTDVGCKSSWENALSDGTMQKVFGVIGPTNAEGSIPPPGQSTSRGATLGTRNDFERHLYNNGFVLKDATVDVSGINPNFGANLVRLRSVVFGSNSPYGPIEITSGIDSHDTGAHVIGNAVDISVTRGSGAAFWTALTQTQNVQMGLTNLGPTATFGGVRCLRESNPPHIHCSQDS